MLNLIPLVEKKKTGEILAAKVVLLYSSVLKLNAGKSSEEPASHHVVLGEQADSQVERQK
jgi:hypothetical protein